MDEKDKKDQSVKSNQVFYGIRLAGRRKPDMLFDTDLLASESLKNSAAMRGDEAVFLGRDGAFISVWEIRRPKPRHSSVVFIEAVVVYGSREIVTYDEKD